MTLDHHKIPNLFCHYVFQVQGNCPIYIIGLETKKHKE